MTEFLTTGVARDQSSETSAHTDEIFASSDGWTGWDGPVWSVKYNKYVTQKDKASEETVDANGKAAPINGTKQNDDLHEEECPCSAPSHHTLYIKDIKRRIEPMVESIRKLEHQIANLTHHLMKSGESLAHKEATRTKEIIHGEHIHQHADPIVETLTILEAQVGEVLHKMHSIVMDAEREIKKDVTSLGKIDQGSKYEVGGLFHTAEPK